MNKSIEQFILLLASSSFNHLEIRDIANWVDANGGAVLEDSVRGLRRTAQQTLLRTRISVQRDDSIQKSNEDGDLSSDDLDPLLVGSKDDPAVQIETMLRIDAGLKTTEASELLLREIDEQIKQPVSLPKLGKNAFRIWIDRVAKKVSYGLLIECATKIKNEIAKPSSIQQPPEQEKEKKNEGE